MGRLNEESVNRTDGEDAVSVFRVSTLDAQGCRDLSVNAAASKEVPTYFRRFRFLLEPPRLLVLHHNTSSFIRDTADKNCICTPAVPNCNDWATFPCPDCR